MNNPDITMEEYIKLEAKKAHRRDFPTIVFNDPLETNHKMLSEPTENEDNKVNISLDDVVVEQSNSSIKANVDTHSHEFDENFPMNHDIHSNLSL
nr:hypothetical protein [Tanacetum cinerariifolium]